MESNTSDSVAEDGPKFEKKIVHQQSRSARQEVLIRELTDMGFLRAAVLQVIRAAAAVCWTFADLPTYYVYVQVVENAGDVPKDLIVEQLLTSNCEPADPIPVVEDDGDQMWEDVTVCYKMVIVMNTGLSMGLGKIASQVPNSILYYCFKVTKPDNLKVLCINSQAGRP